MQKLRHSTAPPLAVLLLLVGLLALPGIESPAAAGAVHLPKFSGDAPGRITCSLSLTVEFSPPLTGSGGGTGASGTKAGKLSGCTATTGTVTIASGTVSGSFASSPLNCHDSIAQVTEALDVSWKGEVNGTVATFPDATVYGGTAGFSPSSLDGPTASGSFGGPADVLLNTPSASQVAAGCAGKKGLGKIALTGVLTAGTPTGSATLPTSWWKPPLGNVPWQWELDHALSLASPTDMGTNDTLPDGQPAPDPVVYDIDGIDNSAATVTALHAMGDHAICYVEVGSAGNYYSAKEEGLGTSYYDQFKEAGLLGHKLTGYPESFLNITSLTTLAIVEDMIAQQCYAKGFDAVETDLDETYNDNEGATGFTITQVDETFYLTLLADFMHSLGLGWIAKNLDDTGDTFATTMEPLADGMITEQCNQYDTCGALSKYVGVKAVFNAEYPPETTAEFCASDDASGFNGALFPVALNGARHPCR
jgi:hypothetical protein